MRAPFFLAALSAAFALVGGAPADLRGLGERVVFARSCSECDPAAYCEFAHPSAPADAVACVTHRTSRSLMRRYCAGTWTTQPLGPGLRCAGSGGGSYMASEGTEADVPTYADQCKDYCDGDTGSATDVVAEVRLNDFGLICCFCTAASSCTPESAPFFNASIAYVNAGGCN